MSHCGNCSSCAESEGKAKEYINNAGYSAVRCPFCGHEITLLKMPANHKTGCAECDTVIEIIPLLLH